MPAKDIPVDVIREIVSRALYPAVVDYSPRDGVTCPVCRGQLPPSRMGIYSSQGWSGSVKERYHRCTICGARFKSVETV